MKKLRRALCGGAVAAALAGCGGFHTLEPSVPSDSALPRQATPACEGSRIGHAQCDVLIENRGASPNYSGWTAAQLEAAYNLPFKTAGKGQNVYVVDAFDNPDVETDFATYRSTMGLPKGTLNKYNQEGQMSNYPSGSPGWGVEIALDVEMVSASCPNCTVNLIEANSNNDGDLESAEAEAVKLGATIVSNSYDGSGLSESDYDTKGVTYLASSGDGGYGLYQPATFDDVVAVGGTMLAVANNKRGYTETTWSDSGGGCSSTDETKPSWQLHSKYARSCAYRMGSDIGAVAVGVEEYDTYDKAGWFPIDGTSIGSPFCAGVFALAGNSTKEEGGKTFWAPSPRRKYLYKVGGRFTPAAGWGSPDGARAF